MDQVPFVISGRTFWKKFGVFFGDRPGKPPLGLLTQPSSCTPSLGMWRLSQQGCCIVIVWPLIEATLHDVCVQTPLPNVKTAAMSVGSGQLSIVVDVIKKPVGVWTNVVLAGNPVDSGKRWPSTYSCRVSKPTGACQTPALELFVQPAIGSAPLSTGWEPGAAS